MRYMMLIYDNEALDEARTEAEQKAIFADYRKFTDEVRAKGLMEAGAPLMPTSSATTVRMKNGKRITTDGPFAETKEQLGGYYLLNCKTLDEALEYAAKIPAAKYGCIEVRPVMELPPG
jgi:hypothetical protein